MKINRDFLAACLLIAIGAFVSIYATSHYTIGTIKDMGPGYAPLALAVALMVLGGIAALASQYARGDQETDRRLELGTAVPVIVGTLAFALSITSIGLVPAIFLLVLISSRADKRLTQKTSLILATGLSVISWLVFIVALKMTLPVIG